MRKLLRDIKYSKDGNLYELAHRLINKNDEIGKKELEIDGQLKEVNKENLDKKLEIEYKSNAYYHFYTTSIEKDKSLLNLSVAGLGFLVTFINIASKFNAFEYTIFVVAVLSFLICTSRVINILDLNQKCIIALTTESDELPIIIDKLDKLDWWAKKSFYSGIIMALILGLCVSITNPSKENQMSSVKKEVSTGESQQTNESVSGVDLMKKSFSGAAQMKPNTDTASTSGNNNTQNTNNNSGKK